MSQPEREEDDAQALARFGYAQELVRAMGGFSSFAISFSIISVVTGVLTTYKVAIAGAGPAGLGLGWPLVCLGTLLVALAMGELASAFPTAGALYHWSAMLGGPGWGWFTAATNLTGQVAIVAAIDLGCAQQLAATLRLPPSSGLPLFVLVAASHGLLNAYSVRVVAWLNSFSATVHIAGVVVIVAALLALGRTQPASFLVHTGFTTRADGSYTLGFLNALMLGMWTFTGYDASAHVSEETHDPARRAPVGIVMAVVVSALAGYLLAAALTLAIRDLPAVAADPQPALRVLRDALGERAGSLTMGLGVLAMWFCGLSSVTSASRTLFAFARDGGLPAALRRVEPRHKTPRMAIAVAVVLPCALVAVTDAFGDAVFLAVASLATTGLYVSYALPIALGAVARHRGVWRQRGPWHLGALGLPIAWAAVAWTLFALLALSLPPNTTSAWMLAGALLVLTLLYLTVARRRFKGPNVTLRSFESDRRD